MQNFFIPILILSLGAICFGQTDLQALFTAEKTFEQMIAEKGIKAASLEVLTDDSVIFHPGPIKGKKYWNTHDDPPSVKYVRKVTYGDIDANGALGYTAGNWRSYTNDKNGAPPEFGEYVTIWEKRIDGKFHIYLDIAVTHDKLSDMDADAKSPPDEHRYPNKRGLTPVDASMNFLRMSQSRLDEAYKQFAADDVRILIERQASILGKKDVIRKMARYRSVEFPKDIVLFSSTDLAYIWNPCQYSNSDEGMEQGNCLHIWKFRNKKWWIVFGVFAPIKNENIPTLKIKPKT